MMISKKTKKYLSGDLLLLLSTLMFLFLNKEAGYLNYILSFLSLCLLTPLNKLITRYIKLNTDDSKILIQLPILLAVNFLLFFGLKEQSSVTNQLNHNLLDKYEIIQKLSLISDNNATLSSIDSNWATIKRLYKSSGETTKVVNPILYNKLTSNIKLLIERNLYTEAIDNINYLIEEGFSNSELYYYLGLCNYHLNDKLSAIKNFKISLDGGNSSASIMYDKLNPIKKRISNYVTLCCDGSISYSVGKGTCSWHGGVCQWDYPLYEEYREY
jgi:hypothetical protein